MNKDLRKKKPKMILKNFFFKMMNNTGFGKTMER